MALTLEYDLQEIFTKSVEIEDLGNIFLRCTEEAFGNEYYFVLKTIMGKSHLLKFGPCFPETEILLKNFTANYKKFDYKESTILKEVKLFVNDGKKTITKVENISMEEALAEFPAVAELFEVID